jgi:hypothetical protein
MITRRVANTREPGRFRTGAHGSARRVIETQERVLRAVADSTVVLANVGAQLSIRCAPLGTYEVQFRPHPAPRFCADPQAAERSDSGRAWLDSVRQPESAERQVGRAESGHRRSRRSSARERVSPVGAYRARRGMLHGDGRVGPSSANVPARSGAVDGSWPGTTSRRLGLPGTMIPGDRLVVHFAVLARVETHQRPYRAV